MELVQWIVPQEDGSLAVGWAPVWADRLPSLGRAKGPIRRRGAPLVSRWLPHPLAIGASGDSVDDIAKLAPGTLGAAFSIAIDSVDQRPLLPPGADDVRFAGVVAELVRVVADLSEAAGLPATHIAPLPELRGVDLCIGALGVMTVSQLADALLLLRAAIESCLHARGLALVDAKVRLGDAHGALDGKVASFIRGKR
jgi:hypothetical protein